jgi:hypothetical protein
MITRLRYWDDVLWGIAAAIALHGLLGLPWSQDQLSELATMDTRSAMRIEGELQLSAKKLKIVSKHGVMLDCLPVYCGFPGIAQFNGKNVTVMVAEARIIRVDGENQTINRLDQEIDELKRARGQLLIELLFAGLMAALAWRLKGIRIRTKDQLQIDNWKESERNELIAYAAHSGVDGFAIVGKDARTMRYCEQPLYGGVYVDAVQALEIERILRNAAGEYFHWIWRSDSPRYLKLITQVNAKIILGKDYLEP